MIKVNRVEKSFPGNNDFLEVIEYSETVPYFLLTKPLVSREVVPLHHSSTIEILLLSNVEGTIVCGQHTFQVSGNSVLLIPPDLVHSTTLKSSQGYKTVLEISMDYISHYFDLRSILKLYNLSIFELNPVYKEEFDSIRKLIEDLILHDGEFIYCFTIILSLFNIFIEETRRCNQKVSLNFNQNALFQKLINWTQENLSRKIRLEEAAATVGFTKTYFCTYFKQITGVSYVTYLQSLRIYRAQYYLYNGASVSECCYACGYDNISYFIKIFQQYTGETMLQFQKKCRRTTENQSHTPPLTELTY